MCASQGFLLDERFLDLFSDWESTHDYINMRRDMDMDSLFDEEEEGEEGEEGAADQECNMVRHEELEQRPEDVYEQWELAELDMQRTEMAGSFCPAKLAFCMSACICVV